MFIFAVKPNKVFTVAEHVCDYSAEKISKMSGYRLQVFLMEDQFCVQYNCPLSNVVK